MVQSLYEICRDLVEAYRRRDVPQMKQRLQDMALFFPGEGEPDVIPSYTHTVLDWITEEPRDPVDRSSLTVPRV